MSILAIGGFVMKAYDYNGTIIPLGDSVRQVAYVDKLLNVLLLNWQNFNL